jgi:hypothetical protein
MTTREQIAAALSEVEITWNGRAHLLDGHAYRPASLAVWQAFCDWQAATWLTGCHIEMSWQVYVILPASDPEAWATATDSALSPVRDRLIQIGKVSRAEPIALVASDQALTMPAINFTLIT